jgi:hypothetical protein
LSQPAMLASITRDNATPMAAGRRGLNFLHMAFPFRRISDRTGCAAWENSSEPGLPEFSDRT